MAVYQFSALSDGQAISFNPNADVLNFDQTAIAAADVRALSEASDLRISASGKDVFLLNVTPLQLATTNVTFADGSRLLFGDNSPADTADNSGNSLTGTAGADHLWGFGGNDTLSGGAGDDWLVGGTGQDNLTGGAGADNFVFYNEAFNTNYDRVFGFVSGTDTLQLRAEAFSDIGALGEFSTNDGRFYAAAGASAGHDADDRIIYNTSNGNLYYDADGSGAGRAMFMGVLHGAPALTASDIAVFDDSTPPPGPGDITGTNGNDTLVGTDGSDTIDGLAGHDRISGLEGDDSLIGGEGFDTVDGGAGHDTIAGGAGRDSLSGGDGDDQISGGADVDTILGVVGNDTIDGGDGDDLLAMFDSASAMVVDLQAGTLTVAGAGSAVLSSIEGVRGTPFADRITGSDADNILQNVGGSDTIEGGGGNDLISGFDDDEYIDGGAGHDDLTGGFGADWFVFTAAPGPDNSDLIRDFGIDSDKIVLGNAAFPNIGATGNFSEDDGRFWAAPGAAAGHDLDDRIIYDTTTGELWYDADGSGAGAARKIATFDFPEFTTLSATDIVVVGESSGGGETITGSSGDDTLVGTAGDDTIDGLAGDDSISGLAGDDSLIGGAGADTLDGGTGADTMEGGLHDDLFIVDDPGDVVVELNGGGSNDTVHSFLPGYVLPDWVNNLVLRGSVQFSGIGNSLDNVLRNESTDFVELDGAGGNDTLIGGEAGAIFRFARTEQYGDDVVDGTAGSLDWLAVGEFSGATVDFRTGTVSGDGGTVSFSGIEAVTAGFHDDLLIASDSPAMFLGGGGRDTLLGGSGGDSLAGDAIFDAPTGAEGDDTIDGAGGNDTLNGGGGNDLMLGGAGNDSLFGDEGDDFADTPQGSDTLDGGAGNDALDGRGAADSLVGGDGNDTLDAGTQFGFGDGADDTLDGGLGDDVYRVYGSDDMIVADPGGIDKVVAVNTDWTLGAGLDNLEFHDTVGSGFTGIGNELDNTISGGSEGGSFFGMGGNDVLALTNAFNFSEAHGGEGNDTLHGARDSELFGDAGNDLLVAGGAGSTMTGGVGSDAFLIKGPASNHITDFASGMDSIRLDATDMSALGASGDFAAGDARFHAASGATGGHDADDRVIYNTSTGELFFDADGSGTGGAQIIATLQNAPTLLATDIEVVNGAPAGNVITGTGGADSLAGTASNDTIDGLGGNDTLNGGAGDDWLEGGTGQDNLTGGAGADSFVFRDTPFNTNYDRVFGFASGTDELVFDRDAYTAIGAAGDFAAGDGRFFAAAGASAAHDADDRLIYNTTNGNLYYDADGSGGARAMFVGVLHGGPDLDASDITVI